MGLEHVVFTLSKTDTGPKHCASTPGSTPGSMLWERGQRGGTKLRGGNSYVLSTRQLKLCPFASPAGARV